MFKNLQNFKKQRTWSPKPPISAIPPALSEIGPYASMVKPIDNVDKMPKAANEIPVFFFEKNNEYIH